MWWWRSLVPSSTYRYGMRLLIVEGQAQKAEPDDRPEFLGEIAKQRVPIVIPPQRFRHADQRVVARGG
jgi:hypothetical protein